MLSSDPWVKSWRGQSTIELLKVPLVDIQNPGPQKIWEVTERGLPKLGAFLLVFPDVFYFFPQARQSQLNLCNYIWRNFFHTSGNVLVLMWFLAWIVTYIYPFGYVMFVEWSSRHQETQAKKALNLERPLCHFLEFLRTMILDIH